MVRKPTDFEFKSFSPGGPAVEMEADLPSSINCSMQSLTNSNSLNRIYLLERALETSQSRFTYGVYVGKGPESRSDVRLLKEKVCENAANR